MWLRTVQGTYMELGYQQRTGLIFAGACFVVRDQPLILQ